MTQTVTYPPQRYVPSDTSDEVLTPQTTIVSTLPHKDTPDPQDRLLCLQEDGTLEQLLASSLASQGLKGDKGDSGEAGPVGPRGPAGQDGKDAMTPPLVIFPYYNDLPPDGYLLLQGGRFDRTIYPILAQKFPSATLPDFRNRVPRGVGDLIAFGEVQEDALQKIQGRLGSGPGFAGGIFQPAGLSGAFNNCLGQTNTLIASGGVWAYNTCDFDAGLVARTADETRVKGIGVNFIIKAV